MAAYLYYGNHSVLGLGLPLSCVFGHTPCNHNTIPRHKRCHHIRVLDQYMSRLLELWETLSLAPLYTILKSYFSLKF